MDNHAHISVIIPTLNEAEHLAPCLQAIRANSAEAEIIVIDGGSNDATCDRARELGATLLSSPKRQRASQLNIGASCTSAELLLFLHADTIIPRSAFESISQATKDDHIVGGAFARKFDSPSLFLQLTCLGAEIRNHLIGWHLGDQAIFCKKRVFERLGGFKEMDQFEDLDFSRRLRSMGKVVTLRPPVISSGRRFDKEGPVLRTWRDFFLTIEYLRGNPAVFSKEAPANKMRVSL